MKFDISTLEEELNKHLKTKIKIESLTIAHGGDICQSYKVQCIANAYFLKIHESRMHSMLESEAVNLEAIEATKSIYVPRVITCGYTDTFSYLLLEHLDLKPNGPHIELGKTLAELHQHTSNYFGWHQDNYIGSTPQPNQQNDDWFDFWRTSRLGYQIKLAKDKCAPSSLIANCEHLLSNFDALFDSYAPAASLLHGDLWSGNYSFLPDGTPVVYDPACYYGDREADLAMTELFDGFDREFYSAYQDHMPLDQGYAVRKNFYNLYHVLNHFNLFGGGYANQAETLCLKVLNDCV